MAVRRLKSGKYQADWYDYATRKRKRKHFDSLGEALAFLEDIKKGRPFCSHCGHVLMPPDPPPPSGEPFSDHEVLAALHAEGIFCEGVAPVWLIKAKREEMVAEVLTRYPDMRQCTRCKQILPLEGGFQFKPKQGWTSQCTMCRSEIDNANRWIRAQGLDPKDAPPELLAVRRELVRTRRALAQRRQRNA